MAEKITLFNWLERSILQHGDIFGSIHFNELDELGNYSRGNDLVRHSCEVLQSIVFFLRSQSEAKNIYYALVFLPLPASQKLLLWEEGWWQKVGEDVEPPSLYLIKNEQIFDEPAEEYRFPIDTPVINRFAIRALFRSFRDAEAMRHSWDYSNGIYLITQTAEYG